MVTYPLDATWILWLGLLILAVWVASECLRHRRLRRFGVPASGLAPSVWAVRISGALLRAAGICAAAAILVLPLDLENPGPSETPTLVIAIDSRTMRKPSGDPLALGESMEQVVRRVQEAGGGCRWAVYALGDPPQLLVPDTPDTQGTLMMLQEAALRESGTGGGLTQESLGKLAAGLSGGPRSTILVVVTADSTENIERIAPPADMAVVMLQLASGSGMMKIASVRSQTWRWEEGPELLPATLGRVRASAFDSEGAWRRHLAPVRYLAGLALLLLGAESARALFGRPREGRG
jgi:hypothetical protein